MMLCPQLNVFAIISTFVLQGISASFDEGQPSSPSNLTVSVTIFGVLGGWPGQWNNLGKEKQAQTASWMSHSLMAGLERDNLLNLLGGTHAVDLSTGTIEAYAFDVRPLHADEPRSILRRTFFDITFVGLPLWQSKSLARSFCSAYFRTDEELIDAFLRTLESMELYPHEAMQGASDANSGRRTLIRLRTKIESEGGMETPCVETHVGDGTLFLLPECPENSFRCGEIEAEKMNLCSPEEQNERMTVCKCTGGYEGRIDLSNDHRYEERCTKKLEFCKGTGDMVNMIVQENGLEVDDKPETPHPGRKVASGVIGEIAVPACEPIVRPDGSKAAFQRALPATCMSIDGVGHWIPERHCEMIPSTMPERPLCTDPFNLGMQDDIVRNCSSCFAEDESCDCTIECGAQRRNVAADVKVGPRTCLAVEVKCPNELSPNWRPDRPKGQRCWYGRKIADSDWCCEEAWGPTTPPLALIPVVECAALRTSQECLTRQQMNRPCCWVDPQAEGAPLVDAGGSRCFAGSQSLGSVLHTCAESKPKLFAGVWNMAMPECKNVCSHDFLTPLLNLEVTGCDDCTPWQKDCECTIACKDPYIWYGGGALGARFCLNDFQWGVEDAAVTSHPVCREPAKSPVCTPPDSNSVDFHDCSSCRAGDGGCECKIKCKVGFRQVGMPTNEYVHSQCVAQEITFLSDVPCRHLTNEETCKSHHDAHKAGSPCCWRNELNSTSGYPCLEFGSPELSVNEPTPQCAPLNIGVFDNIPVCRPTCNVTKLLSMPYIIFSDDCSNCFAGKSEPCSCTMQCSLGTKYDMRSSQTRGEPPWRDVSCEDDGDFVEVPVCFPDADQGVPPCSIPRDDSLHVRGCDNCIPGNDSACDCFVECNDAYLFRRSDPDRVPGRRTCSEDFFRCPRTTVWEGGNNSCRDGTTGDHLRNDCCKEFHFGKLAKFQLVSTCGGLSEEKCLASGDKNSGMACCWLFENQRSGTCDVLESPLAERLPIVACADRPRIRVGLWSQRMPLCDKKCVHDFKSAANLKNYSSGCDTCVPGHCDCEVYCAEGYIHIGGGAEGERSCGLDGYLQPAPLCTKPSIPLCEPPSVNDFISANCSNCHAGAKDCECRVRCHEGFRNVGPVLLQISHSCNSLHTLMNLQPVDSCEQLDKERGGCSAHRQQTNGQWQPCCWRSEGFSQSSGLKCVVQGSPIISAASLPSSCASTFEGVWDPPLPRCSKTCAAPRRMVSLVIVGCDDCTPEQGVSCHCEVRCASGYRKKSGIEGMQRCITGSDGRPEFDQLPDCEAVCATPRGINGPLDVSGCLNDCFPGEDRCCLLKCPEGTIAIGGNERFAHCEVTASGGVYTNIPNCQPVCKAVDDQFKSRKVNGCGECSAGSNCYCRITCQGKRSGGGQEGMYECVSFPAKDSKSFASAQWVWRNSTTWGPPLSDRNGSPGWDELPLCMAPLQILLLDAITKKALRGVAVLSDDGFEGNLAPHVSNANGWVSLMTGASRITIMASADGYATNHRTFDRVEQCGADPANCKLQLAMSRQISGAALEPDGCYFSLPYGDHKWTMRAILSWTNSFNSDVDISARSWDCARDLEKRYECLDTPFKCRRSALTWDEVRLSESRACTALNGVVKDTTWILAFPAAPAENVTLYSSLIESNFESVYGVKEARVLFRGILVRIRDDIDAIASAMAAAKRQSEWNDREVQSKLLLLRGHLARVKDIRGHGLWRKVYNAVLELADGSEISLPIELLTVPSQPLVGDASRDQFSKWVDVNRRIVTDLHRRIDEKGHIRSARGAEGWTMDNHIVLDVDERIKAGPETVTFHNVPPGRYQIYAHLYDSEALRQKSKYDLDIKDSVPQVSLYIPGRGGREVQFNCAIKRNCDIRSRIWQVMDVIVEARGKEFRRVSWQDGPKSLMPGNATRVINNLHLGDGKELHKGDLGKIISIMMNGDVEIKFDKREYAVVVPWADWKHSLEVVYPTGMEAYGVKLVYGAGIASMSRQGLPSRGPALEANQLFDDEASYYGPRQDRDHDRTSYSDLYLKTTCESECVPAKGSEAYATCIDSRPLCKHDFENVENLNQFSTGCNHCVPGSCACEVFCAEGYIRIGGGLEGKRSCGPEGYLEKAPVCVKAKIEVHVLLVDAISKWPLPHISVTLDDEYQAFPSPVVSAANGLVVLMARTAKINIKAWADGYATNHQTFDRVEHCGVGPANCNLVLPMSRRIKGAALQPDRCYFALPRGNHDWTMRVVLSWSNAFESDLDMKARSWDCARNVAERYDCLEAPAKCRRSAFTNEDVRLSESKACTAFDGLVESDTWILSFPKAPAPSVSLYSSLVQSNFYSVYGVKDARILFRGLLVRIREELHEVSEAMAAAQRHSEWDDAGLLDKLWSFRGQFAKIKDIKSFGWWNKVYNAVLECADGNEVEFPIEFLTIPSQPVVGDLSKNQYSKWVGYNRRIVTNLHKRIDKSGHTEAARGAEEWTMDNRIVLDVDEKLKAGPETITFHNVPPGRYQIYAHLYDSESLRQNAGHGLDIKDAKPHVSLYIAGSGGNEVQFVCSIKRDCMRRSRIWQVMDVIVEARGKEFRRMTRRDKAEQLLAGNHTMVIEDFQFSSLNIGLRKGDIGKVISILPTGDAEIEFDRIPYAVVLVPRASLYHLEVVYPTGMDAYRVKLVYGTGMETLSQHSFPTSETTQASHQLFDGEGSYYVPLQDREHDSTLYSDRYLRGTCSSVCVPARGSEAYAGCISSELETAWV